MQYYDGYCDLCNSENCGILAGLSECVWEEAQQAEKELSKQRELREKIVYIANKYNVKPEFLKAILEEFNCAT